VCEHTVRTLHCVRQCEECLRVATGGTSTDQSVLKNYFPSLTVTLLHKKLFPNIEFSNILEMLSGYYC
jgi:hypothetical protein